MVWMLSRANADEKNCLNPFDMKFKGIPPVLSYWGVCSKSGKPQSKSRIMLLYLHVSWFEIILAQQTGESSTAYDVVATGLLWLTHFKWDLVGLKDRKCIRTGDMGPKPTPVIWVACFKQSSFKVTFNLRSARKVSIGAREIQRNLNLLCHPCFRSSLLTKTVRWWEICLFYSLRLVFRDQIPSVRWSSVERRAGMQAGW